MITLYYQTKTPINFWYVLVHCLLLINLLPIHSHMGHIRCTSICGIYKTKDVASFGLGGQWPPPNFFFKIIIIIIIIIYVCVIILALLFYKITFFFPLNTITDFFKSSPVLTNFFTTFLQIILEANSYWFAYEPTTHIIFLLTSNHLLHQ